MTAVMTCEFPASTKISLDSDGMSTFDGSFPSLIIMRDLEDGEAAEATHGQEMFFIGGS